MYKTNGTDVENRIAEIKKRVDGSNPKVLLLRAASGNVKIRGSEGIVGGEILKDLGCVNVADSDTSLLDDLSIEGVVKANPDYIFVTTMGNNTAAALETLDKQLLSDPVFKSLDAVKNNRVYVIDKSLFNAKPNARWDEAYKAAADKLYP